MTIWEWFEQRSFHHGDFLALAGHDRSVQENAAGDGDGGPDGQPAVGTDGPGPAGAGKAQTVSLILPTRNVAGTIGPILDTVNRLNDRTGLLSQVIVVDADSPDGTADIARSRGAEVYSENELLPDYGPAQGKGDAMWRSLSVAHGDVIMYADADTSDFGEHFVYGTLGPLLTDPAIKFTKAAYRRPFTSGGESVPDGGGRVTELMAKPLLNFFYPELTGFVQPLAGEFAAGRELLQSIPFLTGYGVELGILIDVLGFVGLSALAQVDLGSRQNRHQPLLDLARMSSTVLRALAHRAQLQEREFMAPGAPGVWALRRPEIYLHAVATEEGLRLDEHLNPLLERPPLIEVLNGPRAAWAAGPAPR